MKTANPLRRCENKNPKNLIWPIVSNASVFGINFQFNFLFPRGETKGGYMYLSPKTPHMPLKIGHICPFWRVVQISRVVPLVVTFAIFIVTRPDFGDFFRSIRSHQISSE